MKAIILAAGEGRRMRDVTSDPKCLLEINGESLIKRQLRLLESVYCAPVIVVGYEYRKIINHIGWGKEMVMNPIWNNSNTLMSLLFAISGPPTDCLVINGDVVFEKSLLYQMIKADYSACAYQELDNPTDEEVKIKCDETHKIFVTEIGKHVTDSNLEAVGVYLLREPLVKAIRNYASCLDNPCSLYYEDAFNMFLKFHPMATVKAKNAIEIDTPEDYGRAKELYAK
jgi:choline kinase